MAQSAFADIQAPVVPGVVDTSLTRQTPQQLDSMYNTYNPIIERSRLLEEQADKIRNSKLSQKQASIADKLKSKQEAITGVGYTDTDGHFGEAVDAAQSGIAKLATKGVNAFGTLGIEAYDAVADVTSEEKSGYYEKLKQVSPFGDLTIGDALNEQDTKFDSAFGVKPESRQRQQVLNQAAEKAQLRADAVQVTDIDSFGEWANHKTDQILLNMQNAPMTIGDSIPESAALISSTLGLPLVVGTRVATHHNNYKENNDGNSMSLEKAAAVTALTTASLGTEKFLVKTGIGTVAKNLLGKSKLLDSVAGFLTTVGGEYTQERFDYTVEKWAEQKEGTATFEEIWNSHRARAAGTAGATAGGELMGAGMAVKQAPAAVKAVTKPIVAPLNAYGKRKASQHQEKKNLEAARSYVKSGYNDAETKAKHETSLAVDLQTQESAIKTLKDAQDTIKNLDKKGGSPLATVLEVQKAMNVGYESDKAEDNVIASLGVRELSNILDSLTPELRREVENSVDKKVDTPLTVLSKVGILLVSNKELLTQEIKDTFNSNKSAIEEQAVQALKDGALDITFKRSIAQLERDNKITSSVAKELASMSDPKSTVDTPYSSLVKLDGEALTKELAKYDAKALKTIIDEAKRKTRESRSADRDVLSSTQIGVMEKFYKGITGAFSVKPSEKIVKEVQGIKRARKLAKRHYDPKKPLGEQFKEFVSDMKGKIAEAVKTPGQANKQDFANTTKAVIEAVNNLDQVNDIPYVQKVIEDLEVIGVLTKAKAESLRNKVLEYSENLDVADGVLRPGVKKGYDTLVNTAKTSTKGDVDKAIDSFLSKLKGRLTDTERKVITKALAKLENLGKASKAKVISAIDDISDGDKTIKEQLLGTYEAMQKTISDTVKGREVYEKKAESVVSSIRDSALRKEVGKDFDKIFDSVMTNLGSVNIKESFDKITKKVTDADYLAMYQSMKDIGVVQNNGKKVKQVDKVLDENGKPLIKEEVCK